MFDLRAARKSANLTQQGLADLSGINIRQVQKIESGEIKIENVTLRTAKSIADALKLPIDSLLN